MLVFIVLLSSIIIIEALFEWFFYESKAGRSFCKSFREAMRRNNKSRSKSNTENEEK